PARRRPLPRRAGGRGRADGARGRRVARRRSQRARRARPHAHLLGARLPRRLRPVRAAARRGRQDRAAAQVRLAVYTDYPYRHEDGAVYAERAFVLFLDELARHVSALTLVGRLNPEPGRGERSHYRVSDDVRFVPLPHYESLADPSAMARAAGGSGRAFGAVLDDVDAVWLLGPHPLGLVFAAQAARRRVPVVLGVRQDLPAYTRTRHPGRRPFHVAADALEGSWRTLARRYPAVVVGPDLAARYASARRVLEL